ncbi:site-specific integrase [Pelagicoccus sp. SDUM812003]|uniref:tyrosine-type recombinase/integrase n=1 Tax=Pelagicoccus sp. SDUM812003 TaxID=3041267 RepID=UPI00280EDB21|nr:site-specific integrase [Pelagicoccus sp. SDUM812003]MDQ8202693.1 site-specific integrase [Pelagicoccus sp. SDUM812003]
MGRKRKFHVKEIVHPNGEKSYEAYGRVGNAKEPTRKRFGTWGKANAFKDVLEARHRDAMGSRKAVYTTLTDPEVADAESAIKELRSHVSDKSLSWAVHKLFESYNPNIVEKDLISAVREFKAAKMGLSKRQYRDYANLLDGLLDSFEEKRRTSVKVHQVTTKDIQAFLATRELKEAKSRNNVISNLGAFFRWAAYTERKYISKHAIPTDDVERAKTKKPRREIITAEQAAELMEYAENFRGGVLVNFIATALFGGIRPDVDGELADEGLDPKVEELFSVERGTIEVTEQNSKTGSFRDVVIQPALRSFFETYPMSKYPIVPRVPPASNAKDRRSYLRYLLKKFREGCPVKVPHDGLRHSYCSYHVKISGSIAETALQAGDSEATIRKHYMRRVSDTQADLFWAIRPVKMPA